MKQRVLFLGVENSGLSQMAEGLLKNIDGGHYEVYSAGLHPALHLDTMVVETMDEMGLDIRDQWPKPFEDFADIEFDRVVMIRGEVARNIPHFKGNPQIMRWRFDESLMTGTADANGSIRDVRYRYRRIREEMKARLCLWHAIECRFSSHQDREVANAR